MKYQQMTPGPAASEFVQCYWVLETDASGPTAVQRVVPDGSPEIILNLARPFEGRHRGEWRLQPQAFFAGQLIGPLFLRPSGAARIIGIRFHPHAAGRVVGVLMHELTGRVAPLHELSPALARDLERVHDCRTLRGRLACIEAALLRAADRLDCQEDGVVARAVHTMASSDGRSNVAGVAAASGLSVRHFERRFHASVGLLPKLFSRVQRFQRVFHVLEQEQCNWVEAALECGYSDQAHLIRDFRDFAGEAPAALFSGDDLAEHFLLRNPLRNTACRIFPRP